MYWGIASALPIDAYAHFSIFVENRSPPPEILVRICNRRAATVPESQTRLPEPPALKSARMQRLSNDTTAASYQGSSLAAEADLHRHGASNMRLNTGKPTTMTTSRKFTAMNADTYKATKSQISHFQKTQAATGGNVTILATLWRDIDSPSTPRKAGFLLA
jgi:hypothetical protein